MKKGLIWAIVIIIVLVSLWWVFGTGSSEVVIQDEVTANVEGKMTEESSPEVSWMVEVKEFTIQAENYSFSPADMVVKKGDRVKIILVNVEGYHDLVLDEFGVDTGRINEGEEVSVEFIASEVGEFEYYCSVGNHRAQGMIGTLVVKE